MLARKVSVDSHPERIIGFTQPTNLRTVMDLMCFFFEDREFKNPELWSGTQSDRIFAASLRAWPCAITPRDKPGSMRAGQSTMSALKLDTVQGWSGVVEFSSLYSAESLHKFQPKC